MVPECGPKLSLKVIAQNEPRAVRSNPEPSDCRSSGLWFSVRMFEVLRGFGEFPFQGCGV